MVKRKPGIDDEIDLLFQRSLAEFSRRSQALAKPLKAGERTIDAERVKASTHAGQQV